MKKLILIIAVAAIGLINKAEAQTTTPQNAVGLTIEAGDGPTLAGPAIQHHFDDHNAGQAEVLFGGGSTFLSLFYHYTGVIKNAKGLNYYAGAGPALGFGGGSTAFYLRPAAGVAYQIPRRWHYLLTGAQPFT